MSVSPMPISSASANDLPVALEEVVVKAFQMRSSYRERVSLAAELWCPLPERDLVPLLGKAKSCGEPGNAATNDGDTLAVCHTVTLAQVVRSGPLPGPRNATTPHAWLAWGVASALR